MIEFFILSFPKFCSFAPNDAPSTQKSVLRGTKIISAHAETERTRIQERSERAYAIGVHAHTRSERTRIQERSEPAYKNGTDAHTRTERTRMRDRSERAYEFGTDVHTVSERTRWRGFSTKQGKNMDRMVKISRVWLKNRVNPVNLVQIWSFLYSQDFAYCLPSL
jgi:hypothetical protein